MNATEQESSVRRGARPAMRSLWEGVLPESLGLAFVAVILGGFIGGFLISDYAWGRHASAALQAEANTLASTLSLSLGAVAERGDVVPDAKAQARVRLPRVRQVIWTGLDQQPRRIWPPGVTSVDAALAAATPGDGGGLVGVAQVETPTGKPAGIVHVHMQPAALTAYRSSLLWTWGIAAALTLMVYIVMYQRLRRHLRPVAAIERNLQSYAAGVEEELLTLKLSESLGVVAESWNNLIDQLEEVRQQLRNARDTAQSDVMVRFEGAVYRRVVDLLPFGVLCVGDQQQVRYANHAAGALLSRNGQDLLGVRLDQVVDNPSVVQAVTASAGRASGAIAVDHTTTSGENESTLRFRVLSLGGQLATRDALVVIEDISQIRENERARDNFLYHVTHELRTPLTNIHAYTETLTQPGFDDEQTRKECYNVIVSETQRLAQLVENILSISQLEVGTARLDVGPVDFARLVRQIVQDNLGAADEKGVDLTLSLPPKIPKFKGDKQRLSVLLNNLIGNAVKYTPKGGAAQVAMEVHERRVLISVRDTGIGIAPQDQTHVFDKFYRAADDAVQMITGTGLGLALAREVARLHGGEIYLESQPGEGSTFTVELPLSTGSYAEMQES
jgi:signal transduction histidine kinase